MTFLDITASSDQRETMVHVVEQVAGEVFIPLTVGGGIREVADIRRMLMTMKVYVEGMRSLLYYIGMCGDKATISDDEAEKAKLNGLVDLLIPIAKGYVTDRALEVCNLAIQVYGGYGYIKEYPVEQLLRDCRITARSALITTSLFCFSPIISLSRSKSMARETSWVPRKALPCRST